MNDDEQNASAGSRNSPPHLPSESPGSSVSTRLQDEYTELLKYAVGMQGSESRTLDTMEETFQPISMSAGSSARATPVDHQPGVDDDDLAMLHQHRPGGDQQDSNTNSNNYGFGVQGNTSTVPSQGWNDQQMSTQSTIVDPAVTAMGHKLDNWLGKLKSDILAEFGRSTIQSLTMQTQQHQQEISEILTEKMCLTREVNRLRELVSTCEQSLARKDTMMENLSDALAKTKDKVAMSQAFYNCKLATVDGKREKFTEQLALSHHRRQLTLKVLRAWFGVIQNKWRQRVERVCQEQAQSVCLQLTTDYEEKIKSLNSHIEQLATKVMYLQEEREQYAQQVKKAFMRGVCALNMEAMSAFTNETCETPCPSIGLQAPSEGPVLTSDGLTSDPEEGYGGGGGHGHNLDNGHPYKDQFSSIKSLPPDLTNTTIPDYCSNAVQTHAGITVGGGHKTKPKQTKDKARPSTAPGAPASRQTHKTSGFYCQGQPLAPPMASIVVERHNPVTKKTVGKATASKYPKRNFNDNASKQSHGLSSVSRSQPSSLVGQTFKPLAGQSTSHSLPVTSSPSIKVVD